jgi:hypothetical protein
MPVAVQAADAATYAATYTTADATTYTATYTTHATTYTATHAAPDLRRPIKILGACRLPCFPELLRCN